MHFSWSRVALWPSGWRAGLRRRRAWVQIAVATLSGNSLRQTVHTHCASVHQAVKLVAALLRVAGVTAGLTESNDSLPSGLWFTSLAGSGTLCSVIEYWLPLPFLMSEVLWRYIVCCNAPHRTWYRPGGGETIYPRRWQIDGGKNRGGSTSVCGRGPQSAHRWWPAVAKLQAASVPIA